MKKWFLRIAIGLICLVLVAVASLFGIYHYQKWVALKARVERSESIRSFYPSKARVYLYALDPKSTKLDDSNHFHGYPILGSCEITAWDEKAALILSLSEGIVDGDALSMCFDPHHGLRIVNEGKTVDLVICFSCLQVRPFNFNNGRTFSTAGYPYAVYDSLLERHGLPIFRRK